MRIPLALGCAALATFALAAQPASAATSAKRGVLTCNVSGGLGLIITSSRDMNCVFRSNRGQTEHYYGTIRKFGLDIGKTTRGRLVWAVFSSANNQMRGALAGNYAGVSASATVGGGVGANVLVGGSNRAITLQPFSAQAQTGLNLAAGVASLVLRPAK